MKSFITALIAVAIIAVIFFFVGKSCSKEEVGNPDNPRLREIETERDSLKNHIADIGKMVDSLKQARERIKTQIVYRDREIDENIAKDSSKSLVEYRGSLQDNDYLPDGTLYLSYREIGLGAKLMAKVPKLELTINIQDSIILNKDLIIFDKDYIIQGQKEIIEIKNESITYWQELYKDESAWYNENWIWLTLGVIVTGGIVIVSGAVQ